MSFFDRFRKKPEPSLIAQEAADDLQIALIDLNVVPKEGPVYLPGLNAFCGGFAVVIKAIQQSNPQDHGAIIRLKDLAQHLIAAREELIKIQNPSPKVIDAANKYNESMTAICDDLRKQPFVKPPVKKPKKAPDGSTPAYEELENVSEKCVHALNAFRRTYSRTIIEHKTPVYSLAYSPDGHALASGGDNGTITIIDPLTGNVTSTFRLEIQNPNNIESLAFSPDGNTLAAGALDNSVTVWNWASGSVAMQFNEHIGRVTAVAFSPDGKSLASSSWDETIRIWDLNSRDKHRTLKGNEPLTLTTVAFSPDGKTIATGSLDRVARVWDVATEKITKELEGHGYHITCALFTPDGKTLVTGAGRTPSYKNIDPNHGYDATIRFWNLESGDVTLALKGDIEGHHRIAFSLDGKTLAASWINNSIRIYDAATGDVVREFLGHTERVSAVAFSPDGKTLASASFDKSVRIWDLP